MWGELARDGSLRQMGFAILVIALSGLAERGWLALRWQPYFAAGFPLRREPLALARIPHEATGEASGLRWEKVPGHDAARWWADPQQRRFLSGLHGIVWFGPSKRSVELAVRWSPPWTPLLAMVWLAGVGAADGQAWLSGPLAAVLSMVLMILYQREASRAAAILRYAWAREGADRG